mgnify:CR=1 FL=1
MLFRSPYIPEGGRKDDFYTFLIVGRDTGGGGNTDTILLAAYDLANQKLAAMSLLRDTMVNVSWDIKKINSVYNVYGGGVDGIEALKQEVGQLVGFVPDFHVVVEWEAVGELVDAVGGVTFDVPLDMSYDDPTQDLHIHYEAGMQHLDGEDVLKVARCRNNSDGPGSYPDNLYGAYPDGDIGRTRTQQQLIAAILKKALSNPQKINSYVNLFLEYVDTDLEFSEALWFAQPALGLDFSTGFASATLAGENVYYVDSRGYRWGSCYELDPEAALETVNSLINPYNAPLTAADLNIFQKP